jgi:hypothetical protein
MFIPRMDQWMNDSPGKIQQIHQPSDIFMLTEYYGSYVNTNDFGRLRFRHGQNRWQNISFMDGHIDEWNVRGLPKATVLRNGGMNALRFGWNSWMTYPFIDP